jgi:hypothetical protein
MNVVLTPVYDRRVYVHGARCYPRLVFGPVKQRKAGGWLTVGLEEVRLVA